MAVPVPALGLLTYRVPAELAMPVPGARVVVPVGPRTLTGVMLGEAAAEDTTYTIKPIKQVLDDHAFVPPDVVRLTEWVSDYYLAGPGATLAAALPPHGLTARVDRFKTVRVAALTAAGLDMAERLGAHSADAADGPKLGKRQAEVVDLLKGAPDGLTVPSLAERGITSASLTRLRALGLVAMREDRVDRDPFEHAVSQAKPQPNRAATEEQQQALEQLLPLVTAGAFKIALIHGVTGSGKTEVYLRLADAVKQTGRGVLMLVPEIALTPQVAALFRARFGTAVAIQH
ncbi:MAG TPA: DEAD/DEAH box helicase family protein, partial [Vicinamibacterales bacterium]|nr:DEAD/DEAH box helicase family protein [Vicinamibacterales bacterium]